MSEKPPIDIQSVINMATNLANSVSPEEKEKMQNMQFDQLFDTLSDKVYSQLNVDPATMNQFKTMTKTMMKGLDGAQGPPSNVESRIELPGDVEAKERSERAERVEEKTSLMNFEELLSDDEDDLPSLRPYVEDLNYNLPVSLEELYTGKVKKIAVTCERLDKTGQKLKQEKRKIEIPIPKGARDGQEIRYNRAGNERPGYESGDIVITLSQNNHEDFERNDKNGILYVVKNISLYESYAAARGSIKIVFKHLDGRYLFLRPSDNTPLHAKDGVRKVKGWGMPIFNSEEYGDLYIRFNLILPHELVDVDRTLQFLESSFGVLPTNRDTVFYDDPSKRGFVVAKHNRITEVTMEELTPEEIEQATYEDEEYYNDDKDHEDHDDEYSNE